MRISDLLKRIKDKIRFLILIFLIFTACSSIKTARNFKCDLKIYFVNNDRLEKSNILVMFENENLKRTISNKLLVPKNILENDSIKLSFSYKEKKIGSLNFSKDALLDGGKIYLGVINDYLEEKKEIDNNTDYDYLLMNSREQYYTALTSQTYYNQFNKYNCQDLSFVYFHRKNSKGIYFGQKFKCMNNFITPIR